MATLSSFHESKYRTLIFIITRCYNLQRTLIRTLFITESLYMPSFYVVRYYHGEKHFNGKMLPSNKGLLPGETRIGVSGKGLCYTV